METDRLFLEVMADLEARAAAPSEYGMLKAAGLLRQMFLDGGKSLVDIVNRERRIKLSFSVLEKEAHVQMLLDDGAVFYSVEDGFDPGSGSFGTPADLTRDQFLKLRVMVVNRHTVSVHDLIDQLAHVEGGVHAGAPASEKAEALAAAARAFGIGGLPAGLRVMAAVSRVVLKSLADLRSAVEKDGALH
jgi:hypothetical protein